MLAASAALGGLALGRSRLAAPWPVAAGRLKQSVSRWPFQSIPLPELCRAAKAMGISGIDLLQPEEWGVVRDNGLTCSMGYPTNRNDFIQTGFNDPVNHAMLLRELEQTIPLAARAGVPNVIAMFGNRRAQSEARAVAHCVAGLNRIMRLAEEQGV